MRLFTTKIIFLIFISSIAAKEYPGYYVTHSGDTITCTFNFSLSICRIGDHCLPCDEHELCPSVWPKFIYILKEGQKVKMKPKQIKSFYIEDTSMGSQNYIALEFKRNKRFVRVIELGEINLYEIRNMSNNIISKRTWVFQTGDKIPKTIIYDVGWKKIIFFKYLENHKNWFEEKKFKYAEIPVLIKDYNFEKGTTDKTNY